MVFGLGIFPPVPVVRETVYTKGLEVGAHEFEFERHSSSTTYSLRIPFSKGTIVSGTWFGGTTVEIVSIVGHGFMRPKNLKVYKYQYQFPRNGILKSVLSRHCRTTLEIDGRVVGNVADGFRTLNIEVDRGSMLTIRSENPILEMNFVGVVEVLIEFVRATYRDIEETIVIR